MSFCNEMQSWLGGQHVGSNPAALLSAEWTEIPQTPSGIAFFCPLEPPTTFEEVLSALGWQESIRSAPPRDKRRAPRYPCARPALLVARAELPHLDLEVMAFPGCCRNISATGASFLTSKFLVPPGPEGCGKHNWSKTLLVNLEQVLQIGCRCTMGLRQEHGAPLWLSAKVVRKRVLGSKIIELGLAFCSKLEVPGLPEEDAEEQSDGTEE